uniref:Uncharacterized protein n=1 Tax=Electrophorus electricus TaxID=8005 RepID=A0AAY5EEN0_ELEEL
MWLNVFVSAISNGPVFTDRTMTLQDNIMQLIKIVAAEEELQVVVKKTTTGAIIGVVSIAAGSLLGGIPGLIIGAAVGGVLGYNMSEGYKSLTDTLNNIHPEMKVKLCNAVIQLLKDLVCLALDILVERVLGDTILKNTIINLIKSFFNNKLNMKIKQRF